MIDHGRTADPSSSAPKPAREAAAARLQDKVNILEMILECLGEGVIVADTAGAILLYNPAAQAILGMENTACPLNQWAEVYGIYKTDRVTRYPHQELPLFRAIEGFDNDEAVLFIRNSRLTEGRFIKATGRPLRDANGRVQGGVIVFRDVTGAREIEEQLHKDAYRDSLTGIHNRAYVIERLIECFGAARRHNESLCVGLCDLDRLKAINDGGGHALGDRVIRAFAQMLNRESRAEDVVSRIGGDEFCIVFPRLSVEQAAECMERIREKCAGMQFQREDGFRFELSCSVGVAGLIPGMTGQMDLLAAADKALYQAKTAGRNRVVMAMPETTEKQTR